MAEIAVYYENRRVGTIAVHADGPSFTYAPIWLSTRGASRLVTLLRLEELKPSSPLPLAPTR